MTHHPTLFDLNPEIPGDGEHSCVAGAFRRADPDSSREAAESVNAASLEDEVYSYILKHGPSILDEVCKGLKLDKVTASPRFKPLEEAGKIERTGRKRPGNSGRTQTEWRVRTQ